MKREDQLKFCRVCINQKFDPVRGIVCNLTDRVADFEAICPSYLEDIGKKAEFAEKSNENEMILCTASQGKWFANYILDRIFLLLFSYMFALALWFLMAIVSPSSLMIFENIAIDLLLGLFIAILYFSTLEYTTGRTVAKYITGTKVTMEDGGEPGFNDILIRTICRLIPFEPFSFLASDGSGWHDTMSKTKVIDVKKWYATK